MPIYPFMQPDDDDEAEQRRRALLAVSNMPAPAGDPDPGIALGRMGTTLGGSLASPPPTPAPAQRPAPLPSISAPPLDAPEDDDAPALSPLEQLAQRYADQAMTAPAQQQRRAAPQLPAPPMASETPAWALIGGGLLDLALNKGRNAGRFVQAIANGNDAVKYENYRRQVERAKAQSALDNAYAGGGRSYGQVDPMAMAARLQGLALSQQRLGLANTRERRLDTREQRIAESLQRAREAMIASGEDPDVVANLPDKAVLDYLRNSGVVGQARTNQAAQTAAAVSNATQGNKLAVVREGAKLRDAGSPEAMGAPIDWDAEHEAFASHFPDGVVPVEWEQRFKAVQAGPAKQIPMRLEQLYKDMGAGPPRGGAAGKAAAGDQADLVAQFEAANPALTVVQPETYTRIVSNTRTQAQVQQQLATATRAIDASNRLSEIADEYAKIPKAELFGDRARTLREEYEQLKNEHQGIILKIAGSGGTGAEREEIKQGLPELSILGAPNPLAPARLRGVARMLHLNVAANLAPYGVGVRGETEARPIKRKNADVPGRINDAGKYVPMNAPPFRRDPLSKDEESELDKELF